jgi:hypothetical protein
VDAALEVLVGRRDDAEVDPVFAQAAQAPHLFSSSTLSSLICTGTASFGRRQALDLVLQGDHRRIFAEHHRFGQVVEGAGLHRLHRHLDRRVPCDHDDLVARRMRTDVGEHVEPVHLGQVVVEHRHVRLECVEAPDRLLARTDDHRSYSWRSR